MRGKDEQQLDVFSYVSLEQRVPQDHPLRPLRIMTDEALRQARKRASRFRFPVSSQVQAFPRRGRPASRPWAKRKPLRVTRHRRVLAEWQ
jgi:hypothetical protein